LTTTFAGHKRKCVLTSPAMTKADLLSQIKAKKSFLCVGLDTDLEKLPLHLPRTREGVLAFNKAIIEATKPFAVAYKLNTAFYEAMGCEGWHVLQATMQLLPRDCFIILDAKRGDIGNTSAQYAHAMLQELDADAVTVAPYMGHDSVKPFMRQDGKWVIVLALTSNPGADDFQQLALADGRFLYEAVIDKVMEWGQLTDTMLVVGATRPAQLASVRQRALHHFFLVPGVGAQGGSLQEVCEAAFTTECGLLVNSSRQIIYASKGHDYAAAAASAARSLQEEMAEWVARLA